MPKKLVDIENLKEFRKRIDEKYVIEGEYSPDTSVGYADLAGNLDSKVVKNDQDAYLFRTAGGSLEIGDYCKVNHITGGSLGFNQLVKNGNFASNSGWNKSRCDLSASSNILNITITSDIGSSTPLQVYRYSSVIQGHKYLIALNVKPSVQASFFARLGISSTSPVKNCPANTWTTVSGIKEITSSASDLNGETNIFSVDSALVSGTTIQVKNFMVIDITAMLGSTIANYIATLETQTTGNGVAWFKRYFPKDYYPYTPIGGFVNVATKGKKYVGFNQFDLATFVSTYGTNNVIANYVLHNKVLWENKYNYTGRVQVYQKDFVLASGSSGVYIIFDYTDGTNSGFTSYLQTNTSITSENGKVVSRVILKYTNDGSYDCSNAKMCIDFYYDGERDGEYEPYESHTVDLDTNWNSIGIPQIDENGNLYFIGNRYNYDGSVDEEYGIYTFTGNETWEIYGSNAKTTQIADLNAKTYDSNATPEVFCSIGLPNVVRIGLYNGTITDGISVSGNSIYVSDNSRLVAGTQIIYKKATPTQSTATTFQQVQKVDNWGTEQFLAPDDDTRVCEVPVGHDTDYPLDCKSKIEIAPDLPENDGVYVCKVESGVATYTDLPTWLGTNNYVKQEDLSSGITDVAGLTYSVKKLIKTGNIYTLTIYAVNNTGSQIIGASGFFNLPSGSYNTSVNYTFASRKTGANINVNIMSTGQVISSDNLANGDFLFISATYIVA